MLSLINKYFAAKNIQMSSSKSVCLLKKSIEDNKKDVMLLKILHTMSAVVEATISTKFSVTSNRASKDFVYIYVIVHSYIGNSDIFRDSTYIAGMISRLLYGFKSTCFYNCLRDIEEGFATIKSSIEADVDAAAVNGEIVNCEDHTNEAYFEFEKKCIETHSRYLSYSTDLSGGTCSVVELNVLKNIVNKHKYDYTYLAYLLHVLIMLEM
jgi:hypothetical protein